jgi:hypothetical protein
MSPFSLSRLPCSGIWRTQAKGRSCGLVSARYLRMNRADVASSLPCSRGNHLGCRRRSAHFSALAQPPKLSTTVGFTSRLRPTSLRHHRSLEFLGPRQISCLGNIAKALLGSPHHSVATRSPVLCRGRVVVCHPRWSTYVRPNPSLQGTARSCASGSLRFAPAAPELKR